MFLQITPVHVMDFLGVAVFAASGVLARRRRGDAHSRAHGLHGAGGATEHGTYGSPVKRRIPHGRAARAADELYRIVFFYRRHRGSRRLRAGAGGRHAVKRQREERACYFQ